MAGLFTKRKSVEDTKIQSRPISNVNTYERPTSFLGWYRHRQLSDIRETSGSSKGATFQVQESSTTNDRREKFQNISGKTQERRQNISNGVEHVSHDPIRIPHDRHHDLGGSSTMSLPLHEVPERRSSASMLAHSVRSSRAASVRNSSSIDVALPSANNKSIPNRKRNESPVKQSQKRSAQSSEASRQSPSHTLVRTTPPFDILDHGNARHTRIEMSIRLPSPLFVGGGTIEGQIFLEVDKNTSQKTRIQPIYISRLSVDVIGVEEISDGHRWVFLSLASELLDENHPPPSTLMLTHMPVRGPDLCWQLKPSSAVIPFCLNLPLNLGPPPYLSKHASIRYLLCPTAFIRVGEKRHFLRQTWNIQMLPVHDPEKALASLPHPLLASDTLNLTRSPETQTLKLTAGIHRQTWVNGSMIFVDVHVVNQSAKLVKKIDIELEKRILWYSHSAPETAQMIAAHLRLPVRSDAEIVSKASVKKTKDWMGIQAHSSETRTCELEAPRGHVTIGMGRYFEVRYFINVTVFATRFKSVAVQLPVTIIHINSLDIFPNSLKQVAAAIEAKRSKNVSLPLNRPFVPSSHQYYPGEAFEAPRRQSLARKENDNMKIEIKSLAQDLDKSPRRYKSCHIHDRGQARSSMLNLGNSNKDVHDQDSISSSAPAHAERPFPCCYHCHLLCVEQSERPASALSRVGPKLPRLQVSTSGLGFSESDFDISSEIPQRKVMLSEQERKMISQKKELKLQRQWNQQGRRNTISTHLRTRPASQPPAGVKSTDKSIKGSNIRPDRQSLNRSIPTVRGAQFEANVTKSKPNPQTRRNRSDSVP